MAQFILMLTTGSERQDSYKHVQRASVLYSTVLYLTVQYTTVQYNTVSDVLQIGGPLINQGTKLGGIVQGWYDIISTN